MPSRKRKKKAAHPEAARQAAIRKNQQVWQELFNHYGGKCKCCGESDRRFLTVDHIRNDGWKERKKYGAGYRARIVNDAKKTGIWPTHIQILCFQCNGGKQRNGGVCPHRDPIT